MGLEPPPITTTAAAASAASCAHHSLILGALHWRRRARPCIVDEWPAKPLLTRKYVIKIVNGIILAAVVEAHFFAFMMRFLVGGAPTWISVGVASLSALECVVLLMVFALARAIYLGEKEDAVDSRFEAEERSEPLLSV
jgi:hypothetical protein